MLATPLAWQLVAAKTDVERRIGAFKIVVNSFWILLDKSCRENLPQFNYVIICEFLREIFDIFSSLNGCHL